MPPTPGEAGTAVNYWATKRMPRLRSLKPNGVPASRAGKLVTSWVPLVVLFSKETQLKLTPSCARAWIDPCVAPQSMMLEAARVVVKGKAPRPSTTHRSFTPVHWEFWAHSGCLQVSPLGQLTSSVQLVLVVTLHVPTRHVPGFGLHVVPPCTWIERFICRNAACAVHPGGAPCFPGTKYVGPLQTPLCGCGPLHVSVPGQSLLSAQACVRVVEQCPWHRSPGGQPASVVQVVAVVTLQCPTSRLAGEPVPGAMSLQPDPGVRSTGRVLTQTAGSPGS